MRLTLIFFGDVTNLLDYVITRLSVKAKQRMNVLEDVFAKINSYLTLTSITIGLVFYFSWS